MNNTNLKEKVAYLHGLTKGLNLNESSTEGKLLLNIVDVLDTIAHEVKNVNLVYSELENYVESIDDDLSYLEEEFYSEDEEDFPEDEESDEWVEMICPGCKELVAFESDILNEDGEIEITCPYCKKVIYDATIDTIENTSSPFYKSSKKSDAHPGI